MPAADSHYHNARPSVPIHQGYLMALGATCEHALAEARQNRA
ncbi:hypothetical protein [uncultured Microbulbifer sp.]|nr:hypothetical protein [uncultured Microbulbifer sp.]